MDLCWPTGDMLSTGHITSTHHGTDGLATTSMLVGYMLIGYWGLCTTDSSHGMLYTLHALLTMLVVSYQEDSVVLTPW